MAEPCDGLTRLLERGAAGPIDDPDLDRLVRRGAVKNQRRHLGQISGVMVLVAAIVVGIDIGAGAGHDGSPSYQRPNDHRSAPPQVAALTTQLAHGTWRTIPAPNGKVCDAIDVATWDGTDLVRLSSQEGCRAPLAYNPKRNSWRRLPDLPSSIQGDLAVTTTSHGLFVLGNAGASAVFSAGQWHSMPSLQANTSQPYLTSIGGEVVALSLGSNHNGAAEYDASQWHTLPNLPLPTSQIAKGWTANGNSIFGLAAADLDGSIYVLTDANWSETRKDPRGGIEDSGSVVMSLERLTSSGWRSVPVSGKFGMLPQSLSPYGNAFLAIGGGCSFAGVGCPYQLGPAIARLSAAGSGEHATRIGFPPDTAQNFVAAPTPAGIVAVYDNDSHGPGVKPRAGSTRIYDPVMQRWLTGPRTPSVRSWSSETWTPYGLIVLDTPIGKCGCSAGGLILVPKK